MTSELAFRIGRCFVSGSILCLMPLSIVLPAYAGDMSASDSARSSLRRVFDCAVEGNVYFHNSRGIFSILTGIQEPKDAGIFLREINSCIDQNNYEGRRVAKLKFTPVLMRGQIFRALYVNDYGRSKSKELLSKFQLMTELPQTSPYYAIREFGICVVAKDTENSRKITSLPTAGAEEKEGYAALKSTFSDCVAPGNTIKFSKTIIEGAVSEALFMKSMASQQVEQVGKP
jgi:hypothetical protein